MIALVTLAFLGLTMAATRMLFIPSTSDHEDQPVDRLAELPAVAATARAGGPGAATAPSSARGSVAAPRSSTPHSGAPNSWMVVPVLIGTVALLVLGLHLPVPLVDLLARGSAELGGTP